MGMFCDVEGFGVDNTWVLGNFGHTSIEGTCTAFECTLDMLKDGHLSKVPRIKLNEWCCKKEPKGIAPPRSSSTCLVQPGWPHTTLHTLGPIM